MTVRPYGYPAGSGPVQVHYATPVIAANIVGGPAATAQSTVLRLSMTDSRLRIKLTLIFVRREPGGLVTDLGATVYVGEEDKDQSGLQGGNILCTDVLRTPAGAIVHQSGPLAIPEDVGLEGWSQEFVTAADSCLVRFTSNRGTGATPGPTGVWVAQARFQPDGQRLHDDDWSTVMPNLGLFLVDLPIDFPNT